MTNAPNRHVLFILSVKAGKGKSLGLTRRIESIYAKAGRADEVTILVTEHGDHAFEAAGMFAEQQGGNGVVFICGGDGSTSEVANALAHTDTAMGVLPLGTANDFAKMLYTKKEAKDLHGLLLRTLTPVFRPIDLIRINGRYAVNIVSFGFDTIVLKNAYSIMQKFPFVGSAGYALGIVKSLSAAKRFDVSASWVDTNGESQTSERPLILGALCNGGYYGNGFNPAPMAKTDDGILHIVLADAMTYREFIPLILRYKRGQHLGHPKIHMSTAVSGTFKPKGSNNSILGNIDGIVFDEPEVEFQVEPHALLFAFI